MSRIDPATGRNKRDNLHRERRNGGPQRQTGRIVPKGKLQFQRDRKTGKK